MNEPLKQLHEISIRNRYLLELEGVGSCFQCFSYFKTDRIERWTDDNQTALCPCCGIDSVLPGEWKPVTIQAMYDRWFDTYQTIELPIDDESLDVKE